MALLHLRPGRQVRAPQVDKVLQVRRVTVAGRAVVAVALDQWVWPQLPLATWLLGVMVAPVLPRVFLALRFFTLAVAVVH